MSSHLHLFSDGGFTARALLTEFHHATCARLWASSSGAFTGFGGPFFDEWMRGVMRSTAPEKIVYLIARAPGYAYAKTFEPVKGNGSTNT